MCASKEVCVPQSEHSHLVGWRVPQECSHTARAESLRRPRPRSTHITHRHSGRHSFSIIIIITRPKPAYGRQGLAGLWGQNTDEVSTFLVFLTSHFAPAALSSELNQPGTIHDDTNPPGIMKTRPGAIKKNMKNQPGTMKNQPGTMKNH